MSSSPDPAKVEANVFQYLDAQLNSKVLYALLYGIYTGILAVTLWNIFINKCWPIRRALVVVVILLHALTTVGFAAEWQYLRSAFIDNGQNFMTIYLTLNSGAQAASWVTGIAASITSILADLILIWYCWMIWGRRWLVVLLPVLFLISAIVSRITETYREFLQVSLEVFPTFYISFTLGTTLSCTLLIVCRILTVAGTKRRTEGRLGVYRRFVEVLVESSAIYSISLILYLAFTIHNDGEIYYLDVIAAIAKGIAPTLLVGRVTAGRRARPGDSWQGSVMASASIRSQSQDPNRTSFQEDGRTSLILDGDLEAQREMFVREPSPARRSLCLVANNATDYPNTDAPGSVMSSPHSGHCPLSLDDSYTQPSAVEHVTRGPTVVNEGLRVDETLRADGQPLMSETRLVPDRPNNIPTSPLDQRPLLPNRPADIQRPEPAHSESMLTASTLVAENGSDVSRSNTRMMKFMMQWTAFRTGSLAIRSRTSDSQAQLLTNVNEPSSLPVANDTAQQG